MLHLDDVRLYELSEAGPLLFKDPARLAREARIRTIPSARLGTTLGLPAPWVEAEAGRSAADPVSLASYWLGRLAPAAPGARKPRRDRSRLPAETLLDPEEAARRLFATPAALERLDREGRMPSLRVDGAVRYDAELVERMAAEADDPAAAEARRAEVLAWARYEYADAPAPRPAMPAPAPIEPSEEPVTPSAADEAAADEAAADEAAADDAPAPGAWQMPTDLGFDDLPASDDLLDVDGFDTIDE